MATEQCAANIITANSIIESPTFKGLDSGNIGARICEWAAANADLLNYEFAIYADSKIGIAYKSDDPYSENKHGILELEVGEQKMIRTKYCEEYGVINTIANKCASYCSIVSTLSEFLGICPETCALDLGYIRSQNAFKFTTEKISMGTSTKGNISVCSHVYLTRNHDNSITVQLGQSARALRIQKFIQWLIDTQLVYLWHGADDKYYTGTWNAFARQYDVEVALFPTIRDEIIAMPDKGYFKVVDTTPFNKLKSLRDSLQEIMKKYSCEDSDKVKLAAKLLGL